MSGNFQKKECVAARFGLLADDITGACDTGVQFAQRGLGTVVLLELRLPLPEEPDLVVLTTGSRSDSPAEAGRKVREAGRFLRALGARLVYKKIDSTLRGNIVAETVAAMAAFRFRKAVLTPAFPAMGRTVSEGWLHVEGSGAPPVDIRELLRSQGADERIEVADAASQGELAALASAAWGAHPPPLLVGSAGLAIEVARILAAECRRQPAPSRPPAAGCGSVVLVVGSTNLITRRQVHNLIAARRVAAVDPPDLDEVRAVLGRGEHLVIRAPMAQPRRDELRAMLESLPRSKLAGLIVTGGETARLVFETFGAQAIHLEQEVSPGMPWGRLVGGRTDGLPVLTKAGGFGKPGALRTAFDFFERGPGPVR